MSKDKKNKSIKNEINTALNSNISHDDDFEDIPYAFANEDNGEKQQEDVISFTNISVSSTDIDDDDADKHIQVTAGEAIENGQEEKEQPKETSKETLIAKKMLKKNNGTAVSRVIQDKPTKKQRQTVIFGVIISFLVCVGLFSTVSTVTKFTKDLVNATSLKSDLTAVVFPMVIIDIPEFETPTNLDSSVIISTAIWSFVTDTQKDMSKYQQDDLGSIYVPDVDIEFYVRKLYGTAVEINHQTVNDSNILMVYNEQEKMYIIDANPNFLPYSPRIDEIKRTGSIYTLTVSYILPTVSWSLSSYDVYEQDADKIMEYRLQKIDDNYNFMSVKLIAINDHNFGSSDETEYIGDYGDYLAENNENALELTPDDQIASDIMAEEAKKNDENQEDDEVDEAEENDGDDENDNDEEENSNETDDETKDDDEDTDDDSDSSSNSSSSTN